MITAISLWLATAAMVGGPSRPITISNVIQARVTGRALGGLFYGGSCEGLPERPRIAPAPCDPFQGWRSTDRISMRSSSLPSFSWVMRTSR